MRLIDQFDQPLAVDMGINFGGGNVGVAKQGLERAQIRAAFQKMRCKSVTQNVRTDPLGWNASPDRHLPDQLKQAHAAQMFLA